MKDSKGRKYDGWVWKNKCGVLFCWTFKEARRNLPARGHPNTSDLVAVKVRLEVVE